MRPSEGRSLPAPLHHQESEAALLEGEDIKEPKKKGWLAVGGIDIEKRRRSSGKSYMIENNKVYIETRGGGVEELEIVEAKEKHSKFRKALPILPVPLAALCLGLSILPGAGTLVSAVAVLFGCPTELPTKCAGFGWNIAAALIQVILAPVVIGWVWSIQRGGLLLQESIKMKLREGAEPIAC